MMRPVICCLMLTFALPLRAQVLHVEELTVRDLSALDRESTIVIIPGGMLEEHGPYLPSFTDGYLNRWLADRTAEALVEARGGTVLMFPMIPLGVGSPEDFGGLSPFPGSYTVRPETLRAVYMDLASALGNDGFQTVFAINRHGSPSHNWALLEASEYFNDRFGGTMVPLTALQYQVERDTPGALTSQQASANGIEIHSGTGETSQTLFLRPDLVSEDRFDARTLTVNDVGELVDLAQDPGWAGYFGAPGVASTAAGEQIVAERTGDLIDLALRILDGFDWRALPTRGDRDNLSSSFETLDANLRARSEAERLAQERWIAGRRK